MEWPDKGFRYNTNLSMQAFTASFWRFFFAVFMEFGQKNSPLCVMQQGAFTGGDYRSLVIPFMAEIRSEKTGKKDRSQYRHEYMHVSQHD